MSDDIKALRALPAIRQLWRDFKSETFEVVINLEEIRAIVHILVEQWSQRPDLRKKYRKMGKKGGDGVDWVKRRSSVYMEEDEDYDSEEELKRSTVKSKMKRSRTSKMRSTKRSKRSGKSIGSTGNKKSFKNIDLEVPQSP